MRVKKKKTVTASAPDHPLSSSPPLPTPPVLSPVPHPCVSSSLIPVSFEDRARRTPCVLQETAGLPLGSASSSDLRGGKKRGGGPDKTDKKDSTREKKKRVLEDKLRGIFRAPEKRSESDF